MLTGSTPARERAEVLERLRTGELRLLVGTHALIQDAVEFDRLALAVVDEQHRFGVRQRAALDGKARGGLAPHLLHLTATPIPRTLSLTLYGDLDTTVLRELPSGRRPVKTWVVPEHKRDGAYDFIRERLRRGAPVLRGLPAGGGVRGPSGTCRDRRRRATRARRAERLRGRRDARADACPGEARGDGALRGR